MSARETTEEAVSRIAREQTGLCGESLKSVEAAIRQAIAVGIREAANIADEKLGKTLVLIAEETDGEKELALIGAKNAFNRIKEALERRAEEIENG